MSDDSKTRDNPVEQVLSDLFQYFETLEAQNAALLQFLKGQKIVTDKKFASYLEQAVTASNVKWRAARVRMEHLLATAPEPAAKPSEAGAKEVPKQEAKQAERESADKDNKGAAQKESKVTAEGQESAGRKSGEFVSRTPEGSRKTEGAPQAEKDAGAAINGGSSKIESAVAADERKKETPAASKEESENAEKLSKQPESESHTAPKADNTGSEQVQSKEADRKDAA